MMQSHRSDLVMAQDTGATEWSCLHVGRGKRHGLRAHSGADELWWTTVARGHGFTIHTHCAYLTCDRTQGRILANLACNSVGRQLSEKQRECVRVGRIADGERQCCAMQERVQHCYRYRPCEGLSCWQACETKFANKWNVFTIGSPTSTTSLLS